jgi:hypothetical protein
MLTEEAQIELIGDKCAPCLQCSADRDPPLYRILKIRFRIPALGFIADHKLQQAQGLIAVLGGFCDPSAADIDMYASALLIRPEQSHLGSGFPFFGIRGIQ